MQKIKPIFKRELLAGLTTFFTMAYIIIVAPSMYAAAGANFNDAFIATCLIIILATLVAGIFADLPIVLAPGLGLLSYFCFVVIEQLHFTWPQALAAVFVSGLIFMLITLTRIRQIILIAIPRSLGLAVAAGIGFFIGFIALKNVGVIVPNAATYVTLGSLSHLPVVLFFLGFFLIAVLEGYKIPGSILIGILTVTFIGNALGLNHFHGLFTWPQFHFEYLGHFDFHALFTLAGAPVLFTFVIVALFDSTGTLLGLSRLMTFNSETEVYRRINRALVVESAATTFSSFLGTSTLSPFIESAAGIQAGGRTGLTAIVIACCFIIMLFCSPVASGIPPFATASALFYVACIMVKPFAGVDWEDMSEFIPAVMTLFMIPLSFSIANGVGIGLICYVALKGAKREWRKIHPMLWILTIIFLIYFAI